MDLPLLLTLLKVASALIAMLSGLYGLGTKSREDDGVLTRAGKFAIAGILGGCVLSLLVLGFEEVQRAKAVLDSEVQRKVLVQSSLYGALSTGQSWVDVAISIDRLALKADGYLKRLDAARANSKGCKERETRRIFDGWPVKSVVCNGYELLGDRQGSDPVVLRFTDRSGLMPSKYERSSSNVILRAGARVNVVDPKERDAWAIELPGVPKEGLAEREASLDQVGDMGGTIGSADFVVGERLSDALFEFDGKKLYACWRRPKTEPLMRAVPIQN